jgi:hypothetical protein
MEMKPTKMQIWTTKCVLLWPDSTYSSEVDKICGVTFLPTHAHTIGPLWALCIPWSTYGGVPKLNSHDCYHQRDGCLLGDKIEISQVSKNSYGRDQRPTIAWGIKIHLYTSCVWWPIPIWVCVKIGRMSTGKAMPNKPAMSTHTCHGEVTWYMVYGRNPLGKSVSPYQWWYVVHPPKTTRFLFRIHGEYTLKPPSFQKHTGNSGNVR